MGAHELTGDQTTQAESPEMRELLSCKRAALQPDMRFDFADEWNIDSGGKVHG